uniref:Uncharacterized protein n=1 Tax=Onchocerca volvulus TaxID=6282 RepID=A0A8R1XU25_ONCVO
MTVLDGTVSVICHPNFFVYFKTSIDNLKILGLTHYLTYLLCRIMQIIGKRSPNIIFSKKMEAIQKSPIAYTVKYSFYLLHSRRNSLIFNRLKEKYLLLTFPRFKDYVWQIQILHKLVMIKYSVVPESEVMQNFFNKRIALNQQEDDDFQRQISTLLSRVDMSKNRASMYDIISQMEIPKNGHTTRLFIDFNAVFVILIEDHCQLIKTM